MTAKPMPKSSSRSPLTPPDRPRMRWRDPTHWIAFGFGTGLSPRAPGTVASAVAAAIHLWLLGSLSWMAQSAVVVIAFALGVFACSRVEREMASHDHGALVWDEFVGVWFGAAHDAGTVRVRWLDERGQPWQPPPGYAHFS